MYSKVKRNNEHDFPKTFTYTPPNTQITILQQSHTKTQVPHMLQSNPNQNQLETLDKHPQLIPTKQIH